MSSFNLAQIKKHSRRVLITKRSLPVFAFLIIAIIVIWPAFNQNKDKFTLAVSSPNKPRTQVEMENLKFFGQNDKKLPMTLKTPSVKQISPNDENSKMEKPIATYHMDSGDVLTATAPYALVNQTKEQVYFEDRINAVTESGYTAKTSQVLCDYTQGTADGDSPISITGPAGKLNAQGIWMADKGNLILFKKKSTALIKDKKNDIHLTSKDGMQIDQPAMTLTAMGDVKAIQNGVTLKADKAVLYYTNDKNNRIEKIIATGHVRISNTKQTLMGDSGIYYPKTQVAEMTQNVILEQNGNKIYGEQATLNMQTGKSELVGQHKVTGTLLPNSLKGDSNESK